MVSERLDALCEAFPDCHTVAYADLSMAMVLVTGGDKGVSRDVLDKLCAEADLTLGKEGASLGPKPASKAISATPTHTKVFVRSPVEPNDVLLCLCTQDVPLPEFISGAEACIADISGED